MDSLINYNLISDLRDMSLEYLDDGFTLNLCVHGIDYHRFYDMDFGHDININKKARDIYHAYLTNKNSVIILDYRVFRFTI